MTESATNIDELPIDPGISQSNTNNVILETKEKNIADSVLQASNLGLTNLPARDMPRTTVNHSHDIETTPNHIPKGSQEDYIKNYETENEYKLMNQRNDNKKGSFDIIFEEFSVPVLLALLYFVFQLPVFKSTLYKLFDFLFKKDGNYNFGGYVFVSLLFGLSFYVSQRVIDHFSI
tara:strand:- start:3084 stop:3611 length:528 start_codon:yes stop_codon:yes gene_type:complete